MGSALCTFFKQKPVNALFFGLHAAGKTTLLYRLKLGEVIHAVPTLAFNLEEVDINGINMIIWDLGNRIKGRLLIRHYVVGLDTVIFIVDSSDHDRLTEAVDEFFTSISETVQEKQVPVLVLANKQDSSKVLSPEEIKQAIYEKGGKDFQVNTALEVFPIVALTLEGMTPAMEWLTSQLAQKMARESCSPYTALWSKATHFPASIMKSAYCRVVNHFSAADGKEENLKAEPAAVK